MKVNFKKYILINSHSGVAETLEWAAFASIWPF